MVLVKNKIFIFIITTLILLIVQLISSNILIAQASFQRTVGSTNSESPYCVLPVSDGYILAGVHDPDGPDQNDVMIMKLDLNFNTVFAKTFGGPGVDIARKIIATDDGGFLIVGNSDSFGSRDEEMLVVKFNSLFHIEWVKTYGQQDLERGFCTLELADGYMVAGYTTSGKGALAIRINDAGDIIWSKTFGFDENSTKFFNVLQADNGNFVFDTPFESSGEGFNFMMVEITPSGGLVKAKSYKAPGDDRSRDIIKVDGQGYYILGHSDSFGNGSSDLLLIHTDMNGTFLWAHNYGSLTEDLWASQIMLTSDNKLMLTCQRDAYPRGGIDIIVMNCDLSGNLQWAKAYGGPLLENQNLGNHETLHEIHSNLFVKFGKTSSFGMGLEDVYMIGFDREGNVPCHVEDYSVIVSPPDLIEEDIALEVTDFSLITNSPALTNIDISLVDSILCPLQPPPLALFESSDTNFCMGGCINFTDLSLQAPDQWEWYFEGGVPATSSDQTPPTICYPDTGCFDVQLIVSNPGGIDTMLVEDLICVYAAPEVFLGNDTSLCFTDTIVLQAPPGYPVYQWSTGATQSSIKVFSTDEYWVRVEDPYGCSGSDTIQVDFNSFIVIDLGPDSTICEGDSMLLKAGDGFASYLWQDGSTEKDLIIKTNGLYWVEVVDNLGCSGTDSAFVDVASLPVVSLGRDTAVCEWNDYVLDAGPGFSSYLWQDSSGQQQFYVGASGDYWVEVTNSTGCKGSDSVFVEIIEVPEISIGNDTSFCEQFSITLEASPGFDNYEWQDGTLSQSYLATQYGDYWVIVDKQGCEDSDTLVITEDCPSLIWFPNSFTPNGDGKNEAFRPVYDQIEEFKMQIYNRWGQLIFETQDIDEGWDGKLNGEPSPVGVYVFISEYVDIQVGVTKTLKGSVTLIR